MVEFYFFGPNLMWSIILSIVLSIILTVFLNLAARKRIEPEFDDYFEEPDRKYDSETEVKRKTKSSGLILVGPIPIVIEGGKIRFNKKIFLYALLFFLILLFGYWVIRTVFL